MSFSTETSPYDNTSDVKFRAAMQTLHNELVANGLVQTADTGQFNFGTATRPANNTDAAPLLYRFDDALQATAPVFIKLTPGTGAANTTMRTKLQVGTATTGAGALSGTVSQDLQCGGYAAPTNTAANVVTYTSGDGGRIAMCWKRASTTSSSWAGAFFAVFRSVDSSGASNSDGVCVYRENSSAITQEPLSFTTGAGLHNTAYCMIGNGVTSSLVGSDPQVYKHYSAYPRMRPQPYMLAIVVAEVPVDSVFSATPVGAVAHDYISLTNGVVGTAVGAYAVNGLTAHGVAMVWE